MRPQEMKRPPLPRAWYRPTVIGFLLYLLFTLAWLPVFGFVSMSILESQLPLWAKVIALVPSIALAGHGFHMMGWFAHDGIHLSLIGNKYWSVLVGCFAGGASMFPVLGYGITHWNHHRFTNQESDPDTKIYPQYRSFWPRFFLGRATANRGYFRNTLRVAAGMTQDKAYRLPFTDGWVQFFAIYTLIVMALWISVYAVIVSMSPTHFLICIFLPYLTAIPASGLRIYLEHNGTGAGILKDTRSYVSPIWTFLMFGNNFHLEHHLYPTVPSYHLPRVHRLLRDKGLYTASDAHVVSGFFAPLRYLTGKYQYPEALLADLQADPFMATTTEAAGQEEAVHPAASTGAAT